MKELEYPFDPGYILTNKKRIKRQLLAEEREFVKKNVAILGGYTTNDIKLVLELFLLNYGIMPSFYESEYNSFYEDAVFDNAQLQAFKPDIIYVCTSNRNVKVYPELSDDEKAADGLIQNEIARFSSIWDSLFTRYGCPIIQNNFEMPLFRLLGNRDAYDHRGRVNFLSRLNAEFYSYARAHEYMHICDINYISADYGLKEWSDPFYYHMYKYALNVNAIPYLSFNVANIIKSVFGKNKKAMVLDLDNTLWGGVVGDDGAENLSIGPDTSEGQAYYEFQRYIKAHKDLGILLNIASKNDEANALEGLALKNSLLNKDDFIVIKANWDSKDRSVNSIAKELNILPDSIVFIDDNPAERHMVTEQIKGVSAPDIGEVTRYIQNIDRNGFFEATVMTADDAKRTEMYKENAERAKLQASFSDYNDYLISLKMKAKIAAFDKEHLSRIAQLTNKSNQFNLTTKRYTQEEIAQISSDKDYITLYGSLEDRFGDNGLVSVVIGRIVNDECLLDLWLMSCRVLKRNMEFAMMDTLYEICAKKGIKRIRGFYYPTQKNGMVRDFYKIMGFDLTNEDESGNSEWLFNVTADYVKKNTVIEV
ncbi:MAG: HAD-IIIC family phosphatase [Lachnospiraceae bacterium]|nr:HAD-IIIC family phosphatase [Lachnospiraceae bacterium]